MVRYAETVNQRRIIDLRTNKDLKVKMYIYIDPNKKRGKGMAASQPEIER